MTEKQIPLFDNPARKTAAPKTCRGRRNPPGVPNRHTVQRGVRFPPSLFEELEQIRAELGESLHVYCNESLRIYFEFLRDKKCTSAADAVIYTRDVIRCSRPTGNMKKGIKKTIQFSMQTDERAVQWSAFLGVPISIMTVEACRRRLRYLKSRVLK